MKLEGSRFVTLIDGNTKHRDLNKGFAIIDYKGRKRFFISETYAQYEKWVNIISKSMHSKHNDSDISQIDDLVGKSEETSNDSGHDSGSDPNTEDQVSDALPENQYFVSEEGSSSIDENEDVEGMKS